MEIIKKIYLMSFFIFIFSCKSPTNDLYGNWSWTTINNEYYEVLIDSNIIIGYRHSFLYPREYKIIKDSIYIDKINNTDIFDLSYKIKYINNDRVLLISKRSPLIELNRVKENGFTIDSIKNQNDENEFELHFSTREEIWKNKN